MNKTKIEWVLNPDGTPGYTWNPLTGCLNHFNGLCKGGGFPCYAYRLAHGRLWQRYLANDNIALPVPEPLSETAVIDNQPFYPRFWPERLEDIKPLPELSGRFSAGVRQSLLEHKQKGVFVCDMGELFGDWIPQEWQRRIFDVIKANPWHRFYLLTKQPQNLIKFSPFPDNCWVGVTATNRDMFNNAVWHLMSIEANVKYISIEPLLSPITAGILDTYHNWPVVNGSILSHVLGWLIIGAQTKPSVFPKIEWVQEIVEAAKQAMIPYFLKDNLASILPDDKLYWKLGYENGHFTEAKPRQEMPQC